jgi:hypothetical protein
VKNPVENPVDGSLVGCAKAAPKPIDYPCSLLAFCESQVVGVPYAFDDPTLDNLIQAHKRTADYEQDVRRVNINCILSGCKRSGIKLNWTSWVYDARPLEPLRVPAFGAASAGAPFVCTGTVDPSMMRKSDCWTPSPPTSRVLSDPEPDPFRAILSTCSKMSERTRLALY